MKGKFQCRCCLVASIVLLWICSAWAGTLVLPDNPTPEERAFGVALTNALESTNIAALIGLHYCERDEAWAAEWYFRQLVKHPCDEVRLERVDSANGQADLSHLNGGHSSLPVGWLVLLRQPPLPFEATLTNTAILPASLFNGSIVITRRMTAFSPFQKQLILAAGVFAQVLAIWYAVRFARMRWGHRETLRYAPLGLSVLLLCFGMWCFVVVFEMSRFVTQPLRLLILPMAGVAALLAAVLFDERRKPTSAGSRRRPTPLDALAYAWRAWKNREGPFASARVRGVVLIGLLALGCWLGGYLWRGTSIQLHETHTQGTVVQSGRRQGIRYNYQVNGREYFGSGVGNSERVYPQGSPVDVKYSAAHPSYSTIDDDPFLFLKQIICGLAIMLGFALLAGSKRGGSALRGE